MRDDTSLTPNVFLVHPNNRKIVSDETTFEQRSSRELLGGLGWIIIMLAAGLILHLVFGNQTFNLETVLVSLVLILFLAACAASQLHSAWIDRRLESGQFLDGKIVTCEAFWQSHGRGGSIFSLSITYRFLAPTGVWTERTDKVERQDLWKQAPSRYKGFLQRLNHPEEIQELAPEADTPLMIRYVDDKFFRVM